MKERTEATLEEMRQQLQRCAAPSSTRVPEHYEKKISDLQNELEQVQLYILSFTSHWFLSTYPCISKYFFFSLVITKFIKLSPHHQVRSRLKKAEQQAEEPPLLRKLQGQMEELRTQHNQALLQVTNET